MQLRHSLACASGEKDWVEEKDWGYQIDQGNTGSRFVSEGETVVQLEAKGDTAVLPEEMVPPTPREVHQVEGAGSRVYQLEVQQPEVDGSTCGTDKL